MADDRSYTFINLSYKTQLRISECLPQVREGFYNIICVSYNGIPTVESIVEACDDLNSPIDTVSEVCSPCLDKEGMPRFISSCCGHFRTH